MRRPWTHDIYRSSRRLALDTRATLNLSDVPTVVVELGNMRNAVDARRMTRPAGRATYARGLAHAVRDFLSD